HGICQSEPPRNVPSSGRRRLRNAGRYDAPVSAPAKIARPPPAPPASPWTTTTRSRSASPSVARCSEVPSSASLHGGSLPQTKHEDQLRQPGHGTQETAHHDQNPFVF